MKDLPGHWLLFLFVLAVIALLCFYQLTPPA